MSLFHPHFLLPPLVLCLICPVSWSWLTLHEYQGAELSTRFTFAIAFHYRRYLLLFTSQSERSMASSTISIKLENSQHPEENRLWPHCASRFLLSLLKFPCVVSSISVRHPWVQTVPKKSPVSLPERTTPPSSPNLMPSSSTVTVLFLRRNKTNFRRPLDRRYCPSTYP